jgi:predicted O-methyltransferase YrrM
MGIELLENLITTTFNNGGDIEGAVDEAEREYLATLAGRPHVKLIGEIGFNSGVSSYTFLEANPAVQVISFDLARYKYTDPAKKHIDELFPGRHTLVRGDSQQTVPEFTDRNPGLHFDLVFIDGGHYYRMAKADIANMARLARTAEPPTMVVVDDLTPWKPWGKGPTRAWREAVSAGLIRQEELVQDGTIVTELKPPGERAWALGYYLPQ